MSDKSAARRPDVIVVGAGVVGASTARELAHAGARVLLIERDQEPGAGSRAAAGVGVPSVRLLQDPPMLAFALRGQRTLAKDLDRLATPARPLSGACGVLRPVADEAAADRLAALAAEHPGFLGSWASPDEVAALEPTMRKAAHGAYVDPGATVVDAPAYVDALVAEARRAGVTVRTDCPLLGLRSDDQGVTAELPDGPVRADTLVLAAGAWAGALPGLPALPVRPLRGQMLRLAPESADQRPRHIVSGPLYLAPAPDGRTVLVGATEEDTGLTPGPTVEGTLMLLAHVARNWPALRTARVVDTWYGFRAATKDGRPLIGGLPGHPRVVVATGHGGQGILTGGRTGELVAALVSGEQPAELVDFDPARTTL
ncbi:FAD-dependent oxidoreductase [Streptomyces sp. 71268]|uniref:NAD(P)/FAD-dependent oxidoreductase n=1 Tax=Streptomyces sp. 71268 TaxID=3002640 RepID=UPI0023F73663|nr:FAD-dependent oxidoreductase [Streptomyces sp. 71268]WEV29178.1 FAD-dependent oxidoreductase [Streptomyces sp. 71268]